MCWGTWRQHPPPPTPPTPDSAVRTSAAHSGLQSGARPLGRRRLRAQGPEVRAVWGLGDHHGTGPVAWDPLPSFMLPWEDVLGRALPPRGQQELLCWEKQTGKQKRQRIP